MVKEVFETRMSSKGQIIIVQEIRENLGLKEKQKFIERTEHGKIILDPVQDISKLGGILKKMGKGKKIAELVAETKEGWD